MLFLLLVSELISGSGVMVADIDFGGGGSPVVDLNSCSTSPNLLMIVLNILSKICNSLLKLLSIDCRWNHIFK